MRKHRIYTVANHKGGTGKSTTVLNIGAGFAKKKKKTLLIDIDPQCNLTVMLGIYKKPKNTLYEILADNCVANEALINIDKNFDLIPSSLDLAGSELELRQKKKPQYILKSKISNIVKEYDYILIDAPPSMGLLTINGLVASDKVFIPILSEFISLHGLNKFIEILNKVKGLNKELQIGGVIATRYDQRKILNRSVVDKTREIMGDLFLKTVIRENVTVAESIANAQDIFSYAPKSNGAMDYYKLVNEILLIDKKETENAK